MQRSGLARLLGQYLFSRDRLKLWLLFGIVLGAYVVNIRLAILYNDWNGRFFDALQKVDQEGIYRELFYFIGLAAAIIVLLVWAGYLKDRLILALRRDVTEIFFARWLSSRSAHYLLRESGKEPDNPDQRITEYILSAADELNGRPRKKLGYRTPEELFEQFLDSVYAASGCDSIVHDGSQRLPPCPML